MDTFEYGLHVGFDETRCGGDQLAEQPGAVLFVAAHSAVLQLGEQLDEELAQGRHDVGWIHRRQLPDDAHGHLADFKDLIVEGHCDGAEVFSQRQIRVEVRVEAGEDAVADTGIRIGDGGYEQLAEDIGHRGGDQPHAAAPQRPLLQLCRFLEGAFEQLAARPHRIQPDGALLAAQEMVGAVAYKLQQQRLALEVEAAQRPQRQDGAVDVLATPRSYRLKGHRTSGGHMLRHS